jgi:Arc/MetJ-type ribon-helix-helix transcriptional regulator
MQNSIQSEALYVRSILWQVTAMAAKLKTVHITLTPQIAELLEAEVAAGRFANLSEAVRNAAWKAFAEDPAAELRDAFRKLDESRDTDAPDSGAIAAEVRDWRARR